MRVNLSRVQISPSLRCGMQYLCYTRVIRYIIPMHTSNCQSVRQQARFFWDPAKPIGNTISVSARSPPAGFHTVSFACPHMHIDCTQREEIRKTHGYSHAWWPIRAERIRFHFCLFHLICIFEQIKSQMPSWNETENRVIRLLHMRCAEFTFICSDLVQNAVLHWNLNLGHIMVSRSIWGVAQPVYLYAHDERPQKNQNIANCSVTVLFHH